MKRCRLCGFRIWPWQKSLDTMHDRCYATMMHVLYVVYSQKVPGDLLMEAAKTLKYAYNTGEWMSDNWAKGRLVVDEIFVKEREQKR